jgi:hypothetical protein
VSGLTTSSVLWTGIEEWGRQGAIRNNPEPLPPPPKDIDEILDELRRIRVEIERLRQKLEQLKDKEEPLSVNQRRLDIEISHVDLLLRRLEVELVRSHVAFRLESGVTLARLQSLLNTLHKHLSSLSDSPVLSHREASELRRQLGLFLQEYRLLQSPGWPDVNEHWLDGSEPVPKAQRD